MMETIQQAALGRALANHIVAVSDVTVTKQLNKIRASQKHAVPEITDKMPSPPFHFNI